MVEFKAEKVTDHIIRIISPCQVCMYLIIGEERALLIDTGFGIGKLKDYIKSLTKLPYEVVISHGHVDHASGAGEFDSVYLNEKDWELEKEHCTEEHRLFDLYHAGPHGAPKGLTKEDFIPVKNGDYLPVKEGMNFYLGGITVEPIEVPGHTYGSLAFLIPEERICITGDAVGESTLLMFPKCAPITEYRKSLLHLKEYLNQFDVILRNHGNYISDKRIVEDCIELCGEILQRKDAAIPVAFHETKGLMGREKEHPGKYGNIIYSPENL